MSHLAKFKDLKLSKISPTEATRVNILKGPFPCDVVKKIFHF